LINIEVDGKIVSKFSLKNPNIQSSSMDLSVVKDSDGDMEFCVNYLNYEFSDYAYDSENIDNTLKKIYKKIKLVLQNKDITLTYVDNKTGQYEIIEVELSTSALQIDADKYKYRKKEKQFLENRNCVFGVWSGIELTKNQKLYILGLSITNHPKLHRVATETTIHRNLENNAEKILWTGKKRSGGLISDIFTTYLAAAVFVVPLSLFGLFHGWQLFLILAGAGMMCAILLTPLYIEAYLRVRFIVTNMRILVVKLKLIPKENPKIGMIAWFKDVECAFLKDKNVKIRLKEKIKGKAKTETLEYCEEREDVVQIINNNIEKIKNNKTVYMQKFETTELQGQFLKAFEIVEDVFRTFDPYKTMSNEYLSDEYILYLEAPGLEFGTEVAQIAEFVVKQPDKNALAVLL